MNAKNLADYLQDHLAGSVAAVELLTHFITIRADQDDREFLVRLREQIRDDQAVLKTLCDRVGLHPSPLKNAGAWIAEKVSRVKLHLSPNGGDPLKFLEVLEVLSLGIEGKRLLWSVLRMVAEDEPSLRYDYGTLEARACKQREAVETRRLTFARLAFTSITRPAIPAFQSGGVRTVT